MTCKLQLVVVLLTIPLAFTYAQPWIWELSRPGSFNVGYQTVTSKSFGRPFDSSPLTERILPIHVWYPTTANKKTVMKFIDFVNAERNNNWRSQSAIEILQENVLPFTDSFHVVTKVKKLESMPTHSIFKAQPADGKFPLVFMGSGLSSPGFIYTLLAEYLVSHGYVVASMPSLPENTNTMFSFNERGVLNQISDTEMAMDAIIRLAFVDSERIVLAGWSLGGASQILFQMKHRIAKAIVSLDAASQYTYGKDLISKSVYYDTAAFETPFLNVTAAGPARYNVQRSTFFFDSLVSVKKQVTFPGLAHSDVLSLSQYVNWVERSKPRTKESFEKMCNVVLLFLNSQLTDQPNMRALLDAVPEVIE